MANVHPVHDLQANLEAARLQAVKTIAGTGSPPTADDLRELAIIQAALSAVREEIELHGARLGWGSQGELD